MAIALEEAGMAALKGEIPVGAVAVLDGRVVARGHNQRESLRDPTAHAEMLVLREAALRLGRWRLNGVRLYVTLEPCPMCAGAAVLSRISRLIFGCRDPRTGACGSLYTVVQDPRLNHRVEVEEGLRGEECARHLRDFFNGLRAKQAMRGRLANGEPAPGMPTSSERSE
jgi:tRNA(adenine34) deaminase